MFFGIIFSVICGRSIGIFIGTVDSFFLWDVEGVSPDEPGGTIFISFSRSVVPSLILVVSTTCTEEIMIFRTGSVESGSSSGVRVSSQG